ncbi:MAG: glycosyltransferase family 2 protein [Bacilli bacterium]
MKKISIVIPIYNIEKYIGACLESILQQKFLEMIEVILVDDGSTDNSTSIAKEYSMRFPSVFSFYRTENQGLSMARNYGLQFITGEYLTFIDGDDFISPLYVEKLVNAIDKHTPDLLMFNYRYYYDYNNEKNYDYSVVQGQSGFLNPEEFILTSPCAWNKVMKSTPFLNSSLRFPAGIVYEDRAMYPCVTNIYHSFFYLNEVLYNYRQSENSIIRTIGYNYRTTDIFKSLSFLKENMGGNFESEIEFVTIRSIVLNTTPTFFKYKKKEMLNKSNYYIKELYPRWTKNKYLKQDKLSKKLYSILFFYKLYFLCNLFCKLVERRNRDDR